ncbi:putative 3',5'-cyclic phosphodiesterase pde-3 [Dirofilaria immitis]
MIRQHFQRILFLKETRRIRRLTDGSGNLSPINKSTNTRVSFNQPTISTVQFELQTSSNSSSAFGRLAAIEDSDPQKTSTLRQRRTSLPVSSNAFAASRSVLQSNLTEARGLVAEMLANKDLPPTVISGLKAVATLLNPQPPSINLHFDFGLPMVVENPYSGEQLVVAAVSFS